MSWLWIYNFCYFNSLYRSKRKKRKQKYYKKNFPTYMLRMTNLIINIAHNSIWSLSNGMNLKEWQTRWNNSLVACLPFEIVYQIPHWNPNISCWTNLNSSFYSICNRIIERLIIVKWWCILANLSMEWLYKMKLNIFDIVFQRKRIVQNFYMNLFGENW